MPAAARRRKLRSPSWHRPAICAAAPKWRWCAAAAGAPAIHRLFFFNITLLQRFYTLWFPLLTLVLLVVRHPAYLGLAILHLLLFENGLAVFFRTDLPDFLRRLRAAPRRGSA